MCKEVENQVKCFIHKVVGKRKTAVNLKVPLQKRKGLHFKSLWLLMGLKCHYSALNSIFQSIFKDKNIPTIPELSFLRVKQKSP